MANENSLKNNQTNNGRIKNTSAFNIKQADKLVELSWSNNNSDHAITNDMNNSNKG